MKSFPLLLPMPMLPMMPGCNALDIGNNAHWNAAHYAHALDIAYTAIGCNASAALVKVHSNAAHASAINILILILIHAHWRHWRHALIISHASAALYNHAHYDADYAHDAHYNTAHDIHSLPPLLPITGIKKGHGINPMPLAMLLLCDGKNYISTAALWMPPLLFLLSRSILCLL